MIIEQGSLEKIILNALWSLEENNQPFISVSDIQNLINRETRGRSWAYTTVKTVLDRLVDKKVILREKQGKKYYYESKVSRENAGRDAMKKLVENYFNGSFE